jgi:hypothetical protein
MKGAVQGFGVGAAIGAPSLYACNKFLPAYRALPPSLKVMTAIAFTVPASVIQAERAGLAFERSFWDQLDVHEKLRREKELRDLAEDSNSFERAKQWAAGHRFAVVGGGWVAGMGVALGVIMRDPLQTFSQKLVQARMWAQGWTIALVVGAAITSQAPVRERVVDHSWRQMIEENPVSTTKSA